MAYTLGNKCAKNICKRTVPLQLIIKNVVTCFFGTQCICLTYVVSEIRFIGRKGTTVWSISVGADCVIVRSLVLSQYQRVTDGSTDRWTDRQTACLSRSSVASLSETKTYIYIAYAVNQVIVLT